MKFSITGQDKKWPLNTGDGMGRLDCITTYVYKNDTTVLFCYNILVTFPWKEKENLFSFLKYFFIIMKRYDFPDP